MHDRPVFAAILTPHRSMGMKGIRIVVTVYAILASLPAIYLFFEGAWPVLGFLGLDALALYWALLASRRSGRAFEEITLWADNLQIRRVNAHGVENSLDLNPFWVRLQTEKDDENRVTALKLRNREGLLEIGHFLNADEKTSFAQSFGEALHAARQ